MAKGYWRDKRGASRSRAGGCDGQISGVFHPPECCLFECRKDAIPATISKLPDPEIYAFLGLPSCQPVDNFHARHAVMSSLSDGVALSILKALCRPEHQASQPAKKSQSRQTIQMV